MRDSESTKNWIEMETDGRAKKHEKRRELSVERTCYFINTFHAILRWVLYILFYFHTMLLVIPAGVRTEWPFYVQYYIFNWKSCSYDENRKQVVSAGLQLSLLTYCWRPKETPASNTSHLHSIRMPFVCLTDGRRRRRCRRRWQHTDFIFITLNKHFTLCIFAFNFLMLKLICFFSFFFAFLPSRS